MKQIRTSQDLGVELRRKRKASKLTQAQAAALCNVGVRFFSELERGKENAQLGKALHVFRQMGVILFIGDTHA